MVEREWCLPEPCQRKEVILWKYASEAKFVSFNGKKCNEGNHHIFTCQPDILFIIWFKKKTGILLIQMFSHSGCPLSQLVHRCPNLTNFIREHKNTNANTNFVYHVSAHAPNEEPLVNSCANTKYTKTQHKQPHNPLQNPGQASKCLWASWKA